MTKIDIKDVYSGLFNRWRDEQGLSKMVNPFPRAIVKEAQDAVQQDRSSPGEDSGDIDNPTGTQ